jgi:hypothetical protein
MPPRSVRAASRLSRSGNRELVPRGNAFATLVLYRLEANGWAKERPGLALVFFPHTPRLVTNPSPNPLP